MRNRGLSLIETIVVIVIVLIVTAIVAPVYASARRAAHVTATISNLRQIHLAALIYQGENGGGGIYGPLSVSGLPAPEDMFTRKDLWPLFWSPCGQHWSWSTPTAVSYFPGVHENGIAEESMTYRENLITVFDMMCSDPKIDLRNQYDIKSGLGILLSGQLVRHKKDGDFAVASWWAEPQP